MVFSFSRLITFATLATVATAAVVVRQNDIVPPAQHGKPYSSGVAQPEVPVAKTDNAAIFAAATTIDQKSGPASDEEPDQGVPPTVVTVVDGRRTGRKGLRRKFKGGRKGGKKRSESLQRRAPEDFTQVFAGTGTGPTDRDASIQGTAYLTHTLVSNATYNVNACLDFCSSITECVFVNLHYELNNYHLDFEASAQSNLKCVAYGDVHSAAEKTNFGNQQSYPAPAPLIYIQHSSGYALKKLITPEVPEGYEYVFGPLNAANNAAGYMGFSFLDKYDVAACAQECNTRGADPVGGSCKFFNIWRAVVNGNPTTYTCAMYFLTTDASTATNTGSGSLQVTFSRGYSKIPPPPPTNVIIDGGFEEYPCTSGFCFAASYTHWIGTSPYGGSLDATIFHYAPYAHTGQGVGLLGSATGADAQSGRLAPALPLNTVPNKNYKIKFWHSSDFAGPTLEAGAQVDVMWNGAVVFALRPGYSAWAEYEVVVTAVGNDLLVFEGGAAPAWSFIDDIAVLEL